jgi:hypothetical protein
MVEKKLQKICGDIQESLRFAEAKNAALITFNGAALYVMVEGNQYFPAFVKDHWYYSAIVLIIAITLAIIAFLPSFGSKTKGLSSINLKHWQQRQKFGIFYFGHIRLYGEEEYLAKVYAFSGLKLTDPIPRVELDLARQAITLSRITRHKYVFFSWAGHLTLIGLVLPIPILLLYWLAIYINRYTETDLPV